MKHQADYFITWGTYGMWLPGDERGWYLSKQGWQLPDAFIKERAARSMSEEAVILIWAQRKEVERQIAETCQYRKWHLHVTNARSTHVHAVITAAAEAEKVRDDLKAWTTRRLKEKFDANREHWWAVGAFIEDLEDDNARDGAIHYVRSCQDSKEGPIKPYKNGRRSR